LGGWHHPTLEPWDSRSPEKIHETGQTQKRGGVLKSVSPSFIPAPVLILAPPSVLFQFSPPSAMTTSLDPFLEQVHVSPIQSCPLNVDVIGEVGWEKQMVSLVQRQPWKHFLVLLHTVWFKQKFILLPSWSWNSEVRHQQRPAP
jgi:hypothetical protein